MIEGTRFAVFVSATAILALTPGPGILYVLGRTLHGGRREGVLSALGTFVGGSVHVLAAGLGLSAILMTSATAFQVIRFTGAAYLVYLGISMIRKRRASGNTQTVGQSSQRNFLQGIATEVLNPKTALFFLSFIPQFVSPAKGHLILQFLILGAISVVLNTTVDLVVVGFAGLIAQRLARNPKLIERQRTGSGVGMIGLGVYVAVSKWVFGHERQNWMSDDVKLLKRVYDLFDSRDIESVLAAVHPDGIWANGMEGGYVHGRDEVRRYWKRQWAILNPHVEPVEISSNGEGEVVVKVHQVVRDPKGNLLADRMVIHVFQIQNGLIQRFDIRDV